MRLLGITDLHGEIARFENALEAAGSIDAALVLGDTGHTKATLRTFYRRFSELDVPVFLIHGNHENEEDAETLAREYGLEWVHRTISEIDGITILGYGGDGFSTSRADLDTWTKTLPDRLVHRSIVMTHAPPKDTPLDELDEEHVGDGSVRALIEHVRPLVALSGHLHENFNVGGTLGDTIIVNPGDTGTLIILTETKQGYAVSLKRL